MTYEEAIDWLYSTQSFGIKLGLEQPAKLLREYLAFPAHTTKVIHVAGTNGKGSVCSLVESVARAGGHRTGLFTSPHLVDYRERIRVSGLEISEEETALHLTALREHVSEWEHHPTFFELTLAVAMRHFRDRNCELIILETGMGGRLDATSAVPSDVTVITPIAMDHQQWLGNTLREIAGEKAAIMRPGKPSFSAPQEPEAKTVIKEQANETQAPLEFIDEPLNGYSIGLPGEHQRWNANLALSALHAAGITLSYETVRHGLTSARHSGRFEILEVAPEGLPKPTILDVAHNPHAAESLVGTWQLLYPNKKASIIFGAVAGKEHGNMMEHLRSIAERFLLVPVNSPRAVDPNDLAKDLPDEMPHRVCRDLTEALICAKDCDSLLITGSAFLVGEAKAAMADLCHRSSEQ